MPVSVGSGIHGKHGDVIISDVDTSTSVAEVKKWDFTQKRGVTKYASNYTLGVKRAVPGNSEASGALECIMSPDIPYMELDITDEDSWEIDLIAWSNAPFPPGGVLDELKFTVLAYFSTIKPTVDLNSDEAIGWSADFEVDGIWDIPVVVAAPGFMAPFKKRIMAGSPAAEKARRLTGATHPEALSYVRAKAKELAIPESAINELVAGLEKLSEDHKLAQMEAQAWTPPEGAVIQALEQAAPRTSRLRPNPAGSGATRFQMPPQVVQTPRGPRPVPPSKQLARLGFGQASLGPAANMPEESLFGQGRVGTKRGASGVVISDPRLKTGPRYHSVPSGAPGHHHHVMGSIPGAPEGEPAES